MRDRRHVLASLASLPLAGLAAAARAESGAADARLVAIVAGVPLIRRAMPTNFDAAAFCADIDAAGLDVWLFIPVGPDAGRPSTFIAPGRDGRPTSAELDVLARWSTAMVACPDHADRVVTHLLAREGTAT